MDAPANEVPFLVVKNKSQENDTMAQKTDTQGDVQKTDDQAGETIDALEKAATDLAAELEKASKGGKMPWDDEKMKPKLEKLMGMLRGMNKAEESDAKATAKAAEPAAEEDGISVTFHGVAKGGKKQFSNSRYKTLKDALTGLMGLMKEADPEAFGAYISEFAASGVAPGAGDVREAEKANPLLDAVSKLQDTVEGVAKRLEKVEAGSAVSKSLGDEDASKKEVKKANFWQGLL